MLVADIAAGDQFTLLAVAVKALTAEAGIIRAAWCERKLRIVHVQQRFKALCLVRPEREQLSAAVKAIGRVMSEISVLYDAFLMHFLVRVQLRVHST